MHGADVITDFLYVRFRRKYAAVCARLYGDDERRRSSRSTDARAWPRSRWAIAATTDRSDAAFREGDGGGSLAVPVDEVCVRAEADDGVVHVRCDELEAARNKFVIIDADAFERLPDQADRREAVLDLDEIVLQIAAVDHARRYRRHFRAQRDGLVDVASLEHVSEAPNVFGVWREFGGGGAFCRIFHELIGPSVAFRGRRGRRITVCSHPFHKPRLPLRQHQNHFALEFNGVVCQNEFHVELELGEI